MNGILGKSKYSTLRIILDSGAISLVVLGKNTQKLCRKNTQPVKWSTQGGDFLTTYTKNADFVLLELDSTKIVTWNFHVDESWENERYDMIIGQDFLS